MKAAIIGSGIGGLAMAVRLADKGYSVTVFEKNSFPGGKISEILGKGYRFDTGPSLFTLPELVKELFDIAGKDIKDYIPYHKLDQICSYFYEDGLHIRAFADPISLAGEIEKKTGEHSIRILKHLNRCRDQYDLTSEIFLFNSLHRFRNYFKWRILKGLLLFYKVDAFRTMHERNTRRFRDKRIVQLFDRYATYNGSNPYEAPATLNVIGHLEHNLGAYFPDHGMRSIPLGLEKIARQMGVRFEYNAKVEEVCVEDKRVSGVKLREDFIPFDLVVSNADVHFFYKNLIKGKAPVSYNKDGWSSSAVIFYWGVNRTFPNLELHNILFSADYEIEFRNIFSHGSIPTDPTVYIFISSKQVPQDAPENSENWFVMINVPPDSGQDWETETTKIRARIIEKINRILKINIESHIEFEHVATPKTIEENTSSWKGAIYSTHSNSRYAAFMRHSYKHRTIKNLYFAGGSIHPGGGIPLCLASAKIASQAIKPV